MEGRDGKGRKGKERVEGGERVGKGEGGLDLNIYLGAPEFLVTPLHEMGSAERKD